MQGLSALLSTGGGGGAAGAAGMGFSPWALLGGSALGALGSAFGGAAQNRQGRLARDQYAARTGEGMNRLGMMYFGPSNFMDMLSGTRIDGGSGALYPRALEGALASGTKPEGMSDEAWGQIQSLKGDWDRMKSLSDSLGGPFHQQIQGLSQQAGQQAQTALGNVLGRNAAGSQRDENAFHRATSAAGELSGIAGRYGAEREGVIRRDADKMNANLDARTRSMLAASGFGGTTEAMQMAGNARQSQESMQTALADLADRKLGAEMTAADAYRGQLSHNAGELSRLGLQRDLVANSAEQANVGQQFQYGMQPVQSAMGVLQGSVMNPWLNQNTSQYYPGQTGMGALGNFTGQMGGSLFGLGMLDLMRRK